MASQLILGRRSAPARGIGFAARAAVSSGELITYSGNEHLMTFSPTGGGKTSGPVICNALTHPGQLIVIDIKGEIYAATAKARRERGQEVHVLDLRDTPLGGSLNPFDLVSLSGTDHAAIARSFASELVERTGQERDRFWQDWSETMITGGIAWLLADNPPENRRLSELFDLFTNNDVDYRIASLMDEEGRIKNRAARAAFSSYLQLPGENTRPSVLGSTSVHLRLFDSDMVRRLTDRSTMDVKALVAGEPMTIYIIVPPFRLNAYRPLLRIWLQTLILAMSQRTVLPKERTLMLCDEIGNLGRIDAFLTAVTLMRSFGVTIWSFWQNVAQLQVYGSQANTLIDNAGVIQVLGARNVRMAQDFANLVGGISAEEIMSMRSDEQLLLMEGKAIRCKQVRYFSDEYFQTAMQSVERTPSRMGT